MKTGVTAAGKGEHVSETYTIKRFEMMKVSGLIPHPSAQMPIDEEDVWAIFDSVKALGAVTDPLLVIELNGKTQVVDGCNRLAAAQDAEIDVVPCLVIETDDVPGLVMEHLIARRKGSTGQRIMAYLETHRREVLKVSEIVGDGTGNAIGVKRAKALAGHVTDLEIPRNLEKFTAVAIAEKLRVSAKDVGLGIELLQCMELKLRPAVKKASMQFAATPLNLSDEDDQEYLRSLQTVRDRLFMGASPIRRWKAAAGGITATDGKQKVTTDYDDLMTRALSTVINCLGHWKEMPADSRQVLADKFERMLEKARKANLT